MDPSVNAPSWLARTGQRWKLAIAIGLLLVDAMLLVQLWEATRDPSAAHGSFSAGMRFLGVGAALFLWCAFAIRCPKCRALVLWHRLRTEAHDAWLGALLALRACPRCASAP
jgi:hypothetical protein